MASGKKNKDHPSSSNMDYLEWIGIDKPALEKNEQKARERQETEYYIDDRPIEPGGKKSTRAGIFKWAILILLILYVLLSYYKGPILTRVGKFLIVETPIEKADIVVCLLGEPVERGLAAAELYNKGLAAKIFIARNELPAGYGFLEEKGGYYPESRDMLMTLLRSLGVPSSDCLTNDHFVGSTFEEAMVVRDLFRENDYLSLIVVTSPTHTRRAWLTFRRVFEEDQVEIMVKPSPYTDFNPEDWWKTERHVQEVIIEYQKLIYYTLRYLW